MTSDPDYQGMIISVPDLPRAELVGTWWRRRWQFELARGRWRHRRLPPPTGAWRDVATVVTGTFVSDTELMVETFSVHEVLSGDELTYMSVVAAWLLFRHSPEDVLVNGVAGHPLLRMSKLTPEIISWLESEGY